MRRLNGCFLGLGCTLLVALPSACARDGEKGAGPAQDGVAPIAPSGGQGSSGVPPTPRASPPAVDPPAVQIIGRVDAREAAGEKLAWPGSRILARVQGTDRVSVKLEELDAAWMRGGPSEWDVLIDGVLAPKLVLVPRVADYVVASSLSRGPHTIEIYKRSEAQNGVTRFMGFDLHGGTLVSPPPRAARRLEIVGDSQPAAFGVEGAPVGPDCPGTDSAARYENFSKSFGALIGRRFGAEVYGIAYSGKGMARNSTATDLDTMPVLFLRANPLDPTSQWDFSWIPDVVVVQIGGNDFAVHQPFDNGPPSLAEFTQAYRGFVAAARGHYPNAWMLLVLSASTRENLPPGRHPRTNIWTAIQTIVTERLAAGDTRITSVAPSEATEEERGGCDGHGTPGFHIRVARELGTVIAEKTGWLE